MLLREGDITETCITASLCLVKITVCIEKIICEIKYLLGLERQL